MNLDTEISEILSAFSSKTPKFFPIPFEPTGLALINSTSLLVSSDDKIGVFDLSQQKIVHDKDFDIKILSLTLTPSTLFLAQESSIHKYSLPEFTFIETFTGHTDNVTCLKAVGNCIVSGSDDCSVRFWELDNLIETRDRVLYSHSEKVRALDMNPQEKIVASLGYEGLIIVFNYEKNMEIARLEACYSSYICKFSSDCKYVLSTDSSYVCLWELEQFSKTELTLHDRNVNGMDVYEQFCYTCSSDKKIIKTNLQNFRKKTLINTKHNINTVCLSGQTICAGLENSTLLVMSEPNNTEEVNILNKPFKVTGFCKFNEHLHIVGEENDEVFMNIVHIQSLQIKKTIKLENKIKKLYPMPEIILCKTAENQLIFMNDQGIITNSTKLLALNLDTCKSQFVTHDSTNLTLFSYPDLLPLFHYPRNQEVSTITLNDSEIIISEFNGDIKLLNTSDTTKKFLSLPRHHQTKLLTIKKSLDNKFMFSADQSSKLIIWDASNYSILRKLEDCQVIKLYFTQDLNYSIMFSASGQILILSLYDFEIYTNIKTKYGIKDSAVTSDESGLLVFEIEDIYYIENPLKLQELSIVGGYNSSTEFMEYVLSLNSEFKYDQNMNSYLVLPNKLNIVHFYAYFNNPDCLFKAISTNSAFIESHNKHSPLSISLKRNFDQCIRAVYKGLVEKIKSNHFVLIGIEECLIDLNHSGFSNFYKFYNLILQGVNYNLPKFCSRAVSLPVVKKCLRIEAQLGMDLGQDGDLVQAVKYSVGFVGLYVEPGSEKSILFLRSLVGACNSEIFNTRIVQIVLDDKWKEARVYLYFETVVHVCYLTLISIYPSYNKSSILIIAFIMNSILFLYEILQILVNSRSYLKSFKNFLEILNFCLILAFCSVTWSHNSSRELFSILMFISWLRGLTIFRLFSSTRYYINLLLNVLIDIYPFFLIFSYSTVGFGLVFQALDNTSTKYFDYLTSAYMTDLGNADSQGYTKLHWLFFLLITVLNQIIMLNLIVSIMSDTYSRVRETSIQADSIELTNMLIDIETIMFWNRQKNNKLYFFICDEGATIQENQGFIYKIKRIKGVLKDFENVIKENHKVYESSLNSISNNSSYAYMNLLELNRQMPRNFK